jgi:hypothetical protein
VLAYVEACEKGKRGGAGASDNNNDSSTDGDNDSNSNSSNDNGIDNDNCSSSGSSNESDNDSGDDNGSDNDSSNESDNDSGSATGSSSSSVSGTALLLYIELVAVLSTREFVFVLSSGTVSNVVKQGAFKCPDTDCAHFDFKSQQVLDKVQQLLTRSLFVFTSCRRMCMHLYVFAAPPVALG